ncbi:hypothetical protein HID58_087104, partial [Brassica napus]
GPPGFPPLFPELPINEQRMAMTYVSHSDETERNARILRVKQFIADAAESSIIKTTKITTDLDKAKAMCITIMILPHASNGQSRVMESVNESDAESSHSLTVQVVSTPLLATTGFQIGTSMKDPSAGTNNGSNKARCRPPSWKRRQSHTSNNKAPDVNSALLVGTNQSDADHTLETSSKRKPETDLDFPEMELLMPVRQLALLGVVERWQDGKKFQAPPNHPAEPSSVPPLRWCRPPRNWLKCNVSASWGSHNRMGGAAWIVRDHGGLPLSHSRRAFSGRTSCIEAELQSLLWSIRALIDLRIKWVVIESSLTQVREALLKSDEYPEWRHLIDTIS